MYIYITASFINSISIDEVIILAINKEHESLYLLLLTVYLKTVLINIYNTWR